MKPGLLSKKKQTLGRWRRTGLALALGLLAAACATEPAYPPPYPWYPYPWYGYAPGWDPYWDSYEVWPYGPYGWCDWCGPYFVYYSPGYHWPRPVAPQPGPGWGRPPLGGAPQPPPRPGGGGFRPAPRPLPRPHPAPRFRGR